MKFTNRLAARLAREKLAESKAWVVSKKLILETEEGDLNLEKGDVVELGASQDGDLAIKSNNAAVVIISDADLAAKIADVVVNSDELSDVEFVTRDALDTVLDGEEIDSVVGKMTDEEPDSNEVEVAQVDVDKKESVQVKFDKFAANPMVMTKSLKCEAISIDEEDNDPIDMATISAETVAKEPFVDYDSFKNRVMELGLSIEPGEVEKVIDTNNGNKMVGYFDQASSSGMIYPESSFDSADDMMNVSSEAEPLMDEPFEGEDIDNEAVEEALRCYESSEMTGKDYMGMLESLKAARLSESLVAKVAGSYNKRGLVEGCRVFDTALGKHVCVKESGVAADNWIEESGAEKGRFTKRFFKC